MLVIDGRDNRFSPQGFEALAPVVAGNDRRRQFAGIPGLDGERDTRGLGEHSLLPVSADRHWAVLGRYRGGPQRAR